MTQVVRVVTTHPELLIGHLVALGATVPVPLTEHTVVRGDTAYRERQASLDLPEVDGVSLHLVVASSQHKLTAAEFRELVERRKAERAGGAGGPT